MTEADVIQQTPEPRTRLSLAEDLRRLGLEAGMDLLVHGSLRSLGWVCGGPVAVIQALLDVLTPQGTLMMPTHSADLSDPAGWENPPVPQSWWPTIRETMPAFDPHITPSRGLGMLPEVFRCWPGARRSNHPLFSFAAIGRHAALLTEGHALDYGLGEGSPLARLYELNGWVLLLGVGYHSNTSFHLAEYRIPGVKTIGEGCPIVRDGERTWDIHQEIVLNSDPFGRLGVAFEKTHPVKMGNVGSAVCRFFRQRAAVDYAADWLASSRSS